MVHYAPGRCGVHAVRLLYGYRGRFLQCDGYHAYDAPATQARPEGGWQLVNCWTHVRRRFVRRLELDTNPVENQISPIALTRKNALFAGHEVGAENRAMLASPIATCKMSDVNPIEYIAPDPAGDPRWRSKEPGRGTHAREPRSDVNPRRVGHWCGDYGHSDHAASAGQPDRPS